MKRVRVETLHTDALIIGAGIAGLMTAFHLHGKSTILISAEKSSESSSSYAQGGVAAVTQRVFQADTPEARSRHIQDTLNTGYDLCRQQVVEAVITEADQAIETLLALHVPFSQDTQSRFHQGLEGGHSERRIWHVADQTGKSITNALYHHSKTQDSVRTICNHYLLRLLVNDSGGVSGALFVDAKTNQQLCIYASHIVLATGGASSVYQYASGSPLACGEGIAAAYNVGATIANMEFVQFHPTYYLDTKTGMGFLLSEALRGEGAKLLDEHHQPFLHKFGGQELMTREKCAYAIYQQLQTQTKKRVLLDMRHCDGDLLQNNFPHIYAQCQQVGLELRSDCIPVTPVAHYTCGGIDVDLNGCSCVDNLYAVGEVAHTGLHGANRLASNSLLECLVFAKRIGEVIMHTTTNQPYQTPYASGTETTSIIKQHNWQQMTHELRAKMWQHVAIVRHVTQLRATESYISEQQAQYASHIASCTDRQAISYAHMLTTCKLIVQSALARSESRGLHQVLDFPHTHPHASHSYLTQE